MQLGCLPRDTEKNTDAGLKTQSHGPTVDLMKSRSLGDTGTTVTQNQRPGPHRHQGGQGSEGRAALRDRSGEEAGGPRGASPVAPSQALYDVHTCHTFSYFITTATESHVPAPVPGRAPRPLERCREAQGAGCSPQHTDGRGLPQTPRSFHLQKPPRHLLLSRGHAAPISLRPGPHDPDSAQSREASPPSPLTPFLTPGRPSARGTPHRASAALHRALCLGRESLRASVSPLPGCKLRGEGRPGLLLNTRSLPPGTQPTHSKTSNKDISTASVRQPVHRTERHAHVPKPTAPETPCFSHTRFPASFFSQDTIKSFNAETVTSWTGSIFFHAVFLF